MRRKKCPVWGGTNQNTKGQKEKLTEVGVLEDSIGEDTQAYIVAHCLFIIPL
jgi:hypothetical protein